MAPVTRRKFIRTSTCCLAGIVTPRTLLAVAPAKSEPIIDVHQHVQYSGRADDVLVKHQRTLGVTTSILMPSGDRGKDHPGGSGEHEAVLALSQKYPGEFLFFANENTNHPEAPKIIERQLRKGAI